MTRYGEFLHNIDNIYGHDEVIKMRVCSGRTPLKAQEESRTLYIVEKKKISFSSQCYITVRTQDGSIEPIEEIPQR